MKAAPPQTDDCELWLSLLAAVVKAAQKDARRKRPSKGCNQADIDAARDLVAQVEQLRQELWR
jgi:hypothetical protein